MDRLLEAPHEIAALNRTPPNLLNLPFEIRKRILKHLLSTNLEDNLVTGYRHAISDFMEDPDQLRFANRHNADTMDPSSFFRDQYVLTLGYDLTPNVLWTCKQLLCEGATILVNDNDYIALRYQEVSTRVGQVIKEYMRKSGILTFWESPGIFKLPASQSVLGRPVVTIDLEISYDASIALRTIIVPFAALSNLCQALCAYADYFAVEDEELRAEKDQLFNTARFSFNFCVERIPEWKKLGFNQVVQLLETRLFDWFQGAIRTVSCEALTTGLDLEFKIRDWILGRPTKHSLTDKQWSKRVADTWVRRFRAAEDQFLSNDFEASSVSFVEFNALLVFGWRNECLRMLTLDIDQLMLWTHFYLGRSLLGRAENKLKLDHDHEDYSRQAWSAEFYLPDYFQGFDHANLSTGHQVRLFFAKAVVAGSLPLSPDRQDEIEYNIYRCLKLLRNADNKFDSQSLMQLCLFPKTSIWQALAQIFDTREATFQAIEQAILDKFGAMSSVTLNVGRDVQP